jgi:hypothetical protein
MKRAMARPLLVATTAGLVAALAMCSSAAGRPPNKRIEHGKGIGGIHLGERRGIVDRLLGKPQFVAKIAYRVYAGNYTDDGLAIHYEYRSKNGKPDLKRDAYDKVIGITTASLRYKGFPGPGDRFTGSNCLPADRHEAPNGGPPRVSWCRVNRGRTVSVLHMCQNADTRQNQRVFSVGIYERAFADLLWDSTTKNVLDELQCQSVADCFAPKPPPTP